MMVKKSVISEQIKSDLKLIYRDPMLRIIVIILLMLSFIFRIAVPAMGPFLAPWGLTLEFLNPFLVSYMFILMIPIGVGALIGFILLEEKDNRTIKALAVTPMSLNKYFIYRMVMPLILGTSLVVLSVYISWLVSIEFFTLLFIAVVAALGAPLWTLIASTFAKNKIQGFTVLKMGGFLFIIPVIAYFLPSLGLNLGYGELFFGISPTYWPVKAFWVATTSDPLGFPYWFYLITGIIYHVVLMGILLHRFDNVMRQ